MSFDRIDPAWIEQEKRTGYKMMADTALLVNRALDEIMMLQNRKGPGKKMVKAINNNTIALHRLADTIATAANQRIEELADRTQKTAAETEISQET